MAAHTEWDSVILLLYIYIVYIVYIVYSVQRLGLFECELCQCVYIHTEGRLLKSWGEPCVDITTHFICHVVTNFSKGRREVTSSVVESSIFRAVSHVT